LVLAGAACDAPAKREAEQLVSAVERFRRAGNAEKPAMVDAIRAVTCTDGEVCRAREDCLASAEATSNALRLKSEVEQSLAALEKGQLAKDSPEALALASKLDTAQGLLDQGHTRLAACDDETMALKRKHRF
jgi:hypothetical protein